MSALMIEADKNVMANKMAEYLNNAYSKIPSVSQDGRKPQLKWPSGISWVKDKNVITLDIGEEAIKKNMQTDENAFESWILAMVALGQYDPFFLCSYSVTFHQLNEKKAKRVEWQHYQRFLFRLNLFFKLFGAQWFSLNDENRKLAASSEYYKYELVSNTGGDGRNIQPDMPEIDMKKLSESQLEWQISKHGDFRECITNIYDTKEVFRQFPIGIFKEKVSKESSLFPSGKACIDLVADGKNDSSFWIFELKKKGNKALGIISELLFYLAVVSDMITGKIKVSKVKDEHCYNALQLRDKTVINACFLAPDFHPLLLNGIIDILNEAFSTRSKPVSVVFHKAVLGIDSHEISILQNSIWPKSVKFKR